jgi:hypothetical protein
MDSRAPSELKVVGLAGLEVVELESLEACLRGCTVVSGRVVGMSVDAVESLRRACVGNPCGMTSLDARGELYDQSSGLSIESRKE